MRSANFAQIMIFGRAELLLVLMHILFRHLNLNSFHVWTLINIDDCLGHL